MTTKTDETPETAPPKKKGGRQQRLKGTESMKRNADLEQATQLYQEAKLERVAKSAIEIPRKQTLQALLERHAKELPKDNKGRPFYRCEDSDLLATLVPKKTTVTVKPIGDEDEDEGDDDEAGDE